MNSTAQDLFRLDSISSTLKARKNFLLGILGLVAVIIVASLFVRHQMKARRVEPWKKLLESPAPWDAASAEVAAKRKLVAGTDGEAIAAILEPQKKFSEGDPVAGLELLQQAEKAFSNHYFFTVPIPNSDHPVEKMTLGEQLKTQMMRAGEWTGKYPLPTKNADPPAGNIATISTDKGEIRIGLYVDQSPKSCRAFQKHAALLKDQFISRVTRDRWVDLGQGTDGTGVSIAEEEAPFPPFEENNLLHFEGTVQFSQRPFTKSNFKGDLRMLLAKDHGQDGSATVFGVVIDGLSILKELSTGELSKDHPGVLAAPVRITDVRVEVPGLGQ